jgi:hypothetical protein
LISCSNGDFTFLLNFQDTGLKWDFANKGKSEIKFNVALSPQVTIGRQKGGTEVVLHCKNSSMTVTGVDSILSAENKLQFQVPAGCAKSVTMQFN